MSAINGDKSRFNRERKQKIARRHKTRELLKQTPSQPASASTPKSAKVKAEVSA
jgi:hypothetical protein